MTNNIRVFLWLGLALALWINYSQWQIDYGPKPTAVAAEPPARLAPPVRQSRPIIRGYCSAGGSNGTDSRRSGGRLRARRRARCRGARSVETAGSKMRVTTDVLVLDIDLKGGTLVVRRAAGLSGRQGRAGARGAVQPRLGRPLTTCCRPASSRRDVADGARRTSRRSPRAADSYDARARPGRTARAAHLDRRQGRHRHQDLRVSAAACSPSVSSTPIANAVDGSVAVVHSYARIVRTDPPVERSMFKVESYAFRGPAMWAGKERAGQKNHYRKLEDRQGRRSALRSK